MSLSALLKVTRLQVKFFWTITVSVSGEREAALGEGKEPAEGQHRGEQGEDVEAGELLDWGADPVPHRQRTPKGGSGPVPGSGEEIQQSQETHQRLPAKVSEAEVKLILLGGDQGNVHWIVQYLMYLKSFPIKKSQLCDAPDHQLFWNTWFLLI